MSDLRGEVGVLAGGGGAWWDGESADLIWGPGWDQINLRGPQAPGQREGLGSRSPTLSHLFLPRCLPPNCLLPPVCLPTCPPACLPTSVPFQESPKYAARRRGPPGTGLTVPPALLRANSDTSMALPDWMVFTAPGTSSTGAPGPTSGPQGQAQPAAPSAKLSSGTLRSASSPRGARARSPSRGRHPEEAKRQPRGRPR